MKRKSLIAALVLMLVGALSASPVQDAAATPRTIELGVGEHKSWDGDYADTTTTPQRGLESYTYKLVTQSGASRLRVALDLLPDYRRNADGTVSAVNEGVHPDASSGRKFFVDVFDELRPNFDRNGNELPVLSGNTGGLTVYSVELFICFGRDLNGNGAIDLPDEGCNPWTNGISLNERLATSKAPPTPQFPNGRPLTDSGGVWRVIVRPEQPTDPTKGVTGWEFRMRAKLEQESDAQEESAEPLYPNLRALTPFELTFCEPTVTASFLVGTGAICGESSNGLADQEEADLRAEHAREAAVEGRTGEAKTFLRGLRFSSGPENVGDGHLELRGKPSGEFDPETGNPLADAEQHVYSSKRFHRDFDPVREVRPGAGTMDFHTSHGHWHYRFFLYELFQVTSTHPTQPWKKVKLDTRIVGTKSGFCPGDEILGDWGRFYQSPGTRRGADRCGEDGSKRDGEALITCTSLGCLSPTRPVMGLSSGWGDYYEWARIEQFVEFPTRGTLDNSPAPGLYLLRSTVDYEHKVRESNEDDNSSYVLFRVKDGGSIEIIRSGYGPEP